MTYFYCYLHVGIHLYTARFLTEFAELPIFSLSVDVKTDKITGNYPILSFGQGWNQTIFGGHEVNEVHEPLCHMMQSNHKCPAFWSVSGFY